MKLKTALLSVTAAIVMLLGITGAAFAAPTTDEDAPGPRDGWRAETLTTVAETLGLTEDEVRSALQDGQTIADLAGDQLDDVIAALTADGQARIDAALADGTIDENQAARASDQLAGRITALVHGARPTHRNGLRAEQVELIAETLGLDTGEVLAALKDGQTIADLAGDQVDAVIVALVDYNQAGIDDALANGKIDDDRAAEVSANLEDRMTDLVNGELPRRTRNARGQAQLEIVGEVLGIAPEDLRAELQAGSTVADIAGDQTDAVIDALVEAGQARIDTALEEGRIDEDRAAELSEQLVEVVTARVNGERPARPQRPDNANRDGFISPPGVDR